jgi:hypothetical protein
MMQEQEQAHFLFAGGSLSEEAEDGYGRPYYLFPPAKKKPANTC